MTGMTCDGVPCSPETWRIGNRRPHTVQTSLAASGLPSPASGSSAPCAAHGQANTAHKSEAMPNGGVVLEALGSGVCIMPKT